MALTTVFVLLNVVKQTVHHYCNWGWKVINTVKSVILFDFDHTLTAFGHCIILYKVYWLWLLGGVFDA